MLSQSQGDAALGMSTVHIWAAYEAFLHNIVMEAWEALVVQKVVAWRLPSGACTLNRLIPNLRNLLIRGLLCAL